MRNIRLLPVVVLAISALLVLKTLGLVTNGSYVLAGIGVAQAEQAAPAAPMEPAADAAGDLTPTLPDAPTMVDTSPVLVDSSPMLGAPAEAEAAPGPDAPAAEHGGDPAAAAPVPPVSGEPAAPSADAAAASTFCVESDAAIQPDGTVIINPASAAVEGAPEGAADPAEAPDAADPAAAEPAAEPGAEAAAPVAPPLPTSFAASMTDCLPSGDAIPLQIDGKGGSIPLVEAGGGSATDQQVLESLAARRTSLQQYEQDLALRASIVDAAEQKIAERAATLAALEAQISGLVDQREAQETGQFAGIVAMYEAMKPKDAAAIFDNLDMDVLLRVAKAMSPRKMAPILAVMTTTRAQELTVKMANVADQPATQMTPEDLSALPQIVGQ